MANTSKLPSLCHSLQVGDQNDIHVLGVCRFVSEEFGKNYEKLVALYYGKIVQTSSL